MKKILILSICISLAIFLFGCDNSKKEVINKGEKDNKKEITIVTWNGVTHPVCDIYKQTFEMENNVEVNYESIDTTTYEDYLKKLNSKLYLEDGPTMILLRSEDVYGNYAKQGVALEITEKSVPNINKLYKGFTRDKNYYVPISMYHYPMIITKKCLEDLNMESPSLEWSKEDYLKIKDKWLKKEPRPFSYREYCDIVKYPLRNMELFNEDEEKIEIDKVKKYIKSAKKQIYSGNYILNKDHKYDKYIKFFKNYNDQDVLDLLKYNEAKNDSLLSRGMVYENGLKFRGIFGVSQDDVVLLPDIMKDDYQIYTWGFIVNRNGKNTELGLKFINEILDDKQQINVYKDSKIGNFPVIKGIEEEIRRIEKEREIEDRFIKLREHILDKFNKGEYKVYNSQDSKKVEFYNMLEEDLVKIIFDEKEYSDDELSGKLQKLEEKYNMWLTE
ncbi:extracellular solute-binding protein [Dethiothermospora halolimnae]|uniref:extracellular solute-binding protein n=1 Tax=Dethiothermospora halolimnae TaxID=3114390 RepID=UPI003CCB7AAB